MERRQFLELCAYGLGGLLVSPSIVKAVESVLAEERNVQPILSTPQPDSLVFGYAPDNNDLERVQSFDKYGCSAAQVINIFAGWDSQDWNINEVRKIIETGKVPMISLNPWDNHRFNINNFENYLPLIKQKLMNFKDLDNIILRFGYEMNGIWNHNQDPKAFVAAYRAFIKSAKSINPRIQSLWCPNVTIFAKDFTPYYPGDEYVDSIELDGYDRWHEHISKPEHFYQPDLTCQQLFGPDVFTIQQNFPDKPIIIAEIGTARGKKAAWMTKALREIATWKNVNCVVVFGWNKGVSIVERNWDITTDSQMMSTITNVLKTQNAYYTGSSPTNAIKIMLNID